MVAVSSGLSLTSSRASAKGKVFFMSLSSE
jgi:hypothetical protein